MSENNQVRYTDPELPRTGQRIMKQRQSELAAPAGSPAPACTHNVAKGVECRKPATHRVTRDGDNSMEWFFCAEHAAHRKGHIYTVTALENAEVSGGASAMATRDGGTDGNKSHPLH